MTTLCLTNIPCRGGYRNISNQTSRVFSSLFWFVFVFLAVLLLLFRVVTPVTMTTGASPWKTTIMCCTQLLTTYNKTSAPPRRHCAPGCGKTSAPQLSVTFSLVPPKRAAEHPTLAFEEDFILGGRRVGKKFFGLN